MKERPILFSAPMVRAILEGRKTQTRRIIKIPGIMPRTWFSITSPDEEMIRFDDGTFHYFSTAALSGPYPCPYGQPGDRLWVREAHRLLDCNCDTCRVPGYVYYEADAGGYSGAFQGKLRPSIHMPRWASRITIEIVSVRVERLQDISQADAISEGAPPSHPSIDRVSAEFGYPDFSRSWYAQLWEQINGPGSWAANPWVWVIAFRRLTP